MREKYARSGLSPDGTWYEISGSESAEVPVVMIHGVGLDHTMWEPQMAALEASYCVVRYDILGHGRSESRPPNTLVQSRILRSCTTRPIATGILCLASADLGASGT